MEATERLGDLADRNLAPRAGRSFLGAGAYHHFIPATVDQILRRGEFYTAYTPYQPEVAQGTMQVIYEFQSMVASLLGLDVANASIYDGATALAEGVLVALSGAKKRRKVVVSGTIHPAYRDVLETYLSGEAVEFIDLPIPTSGFVEGLSAFAPHLDDDLAVAVIQYPNFFGGIEDVQAIADAVHAAGGRLVVSTSPVPLGLLTPPGQLGADVVSAEGQPFGVPPSFGGPYVGLLATKKEFVRQMPGRLAGLTIDSEGKRGFVLTLQTREQHIRRERGDEQHLHQPGADGDRRDGLHELARPGRLPRGRQPLLPERPLSRSPGWPGCRATRSRWTGRSSTSSSSGRRNPSQRSTGG